MAVPYTADPTLYAINLVQAAMFGISWVLIGGALKMGNTAPRWFALANILFALSVYLLVQRTPQPSYLHYHAVEWLIFAGFLAFHAGIVAQVRRRHPPPLWHRLVPVALAVGITAPFAPEAGTFMVRALVFSFTVAWLAGLCFLECQRGLMDERYSSIARWSISAPFLLAALAMAVRGVHLLVSAPEVVPLLSVPVPNFTPFLWALTVLLLAVNIAMAGLTAGRLLMHISMLAENDYLTGCLNRRAWEARLQIEFERNRRIGGSLACVFFDLDHFKRINDAHGHKAGDLALKHVVQVIKKHLRAVDVLGRFGGEEFMVLMPDTQLSGAQEAANRMRLALQEAPMPLQETELRMTASFGVAVLGRDEPQEGFLHRADTAAYAAKRLGRNRVEIDPGDQRAV